MVVKPYQWLAWVATAALLTAASLASFVPELYLHHYAFIVANTLWMLVGYLWKEKSLLWSNLGLNAIYFIGLITQ